MSRIQPADGIRSRERTEHGVAEPIPLAADLRVGTEFAGYELEEIIGRGGMGVVYRARHKHLERAVALKLLVADLAEGAAFRERFVRESRIAASLQHPSIATVYDAGEAEGLLYLAMQYIDGTDLARLIEQQGALEPDRALAILAQVADALDTAHTRGLVHRDVKPANVLIDSSRAYLTDFGLTRMLSSKSALTQHGQLVGTIDYMAPEQIAGDPVDARVDVYALGCLLYHALTGSVPFERDSQVSLIYAHLQDPPPSLTAKRPDLPRTLDVVVARAMAKRKEERFETCAALLEDARRALGHGAPPEHVPPPELVSTHTVLIAAAEPGLRAMVRMGLGPSRFRTEEAEDLDTAVAMARRNAPDLAFVDWALSGAPDGESCRTLRAALGDAATKVVALVPRNLTPGDDVLRATGADDWIRTPFSPLQLLYKVGDLLGQGAVGG